MLITVFTPTFNRGHIIKNLYNSLRRQTYRKFEWIIVDDGSTDHTEELVHSWNVDHNDFILHYIKTENGGKHRAINKGVFAASGELFFIVDSDDYLTDNALEKIINWENTLIDRNEFCGISGLRGRSQDQMIGSTFDGVYRDAYYHQRATLNINGDKAEVFYTEILRKYLFPAFDNEKFITEAVVWLEMGAKYKIRYFNEVIYYCDYLSDGLSRNIENIIMENPRGHAYYIQQNIKFNKLNLKNRLAVYYYYGQSFKHKLSMEEIVINLGISRRLFAISNIIFKNVNLVKRLLK